MNQQVKRKLSIQRNPGFLYRFFELYIVDLFGFHGIDVRVKDLYKPIYSLRYGSRPPAHGRLRTARGNLPCPV
jgi:hypothetical protein